jgi:hypothetical protein
MNNTFTVRQTLSVQARSLRLFFALAMGLLMLSGCGGLRVIQSQVQTTPQWTTPVPANAFYRWDRLPADANNPQAGWAETVLESALTPLGWTRNDIEAQYSVWVGVRTADYIADSWGRPVRGPWTHQVQISMGTGYRTHGAGVGVGFGLPPFRYNGFPPPYGYAQEVSIVIRDLRTSNVVYQTKATHDSPWSDHTTILQTMISAALQGFPNPPALNRRVDTSIPR